MSSKVKNNNKAICQELVDQLYKMEKDRDKKCDSAKEQLVDTLKVTADKYRTATGVSEALRVLRMINDGRSEDVSVDTELEVARELAITMVKVVTDMSEKAAKLKCTEMEELCEGYYDEDFISDEFTSTDLAEQLMRLDLCRNVGPAASDMVEFYKRTDAEMNDVKKKLEELYAKDATLKQIVPTAEE